jgi:hypothetical protein
VIAGGRTGDRRALVVVASIVEHPRKWRESCKRDREEEVVLAAVVEEELSESKAKSGGGAVVLLFEVWV